MSISRKYNRTYHYPFSQGATNDDRINNKYWDDLQIIDNVIHTEKLDGENTCINGYGVFSRSHAAPTTHPWSSYLKEKHSLIKKDLELNDIEIFGENLYATHSIKYTDLTEHFFVFGVRCLDKWLSWEEVKFYADFYEYNVVPELSSKKSKDELIYKKDILELVKQPSIFGSIDNYTNEPCSREGIVTRNILEYSVDDFSKNVFKYVRKNHVKTDEFWQKNWKRASLIHERKN